VELTVAAAAVRSSYLAVSDSAIHAALCAESAADIANSSYEFLTDNPISPT
jgi:hypothetical protein